MFRTAERDTESVKRLGMHNRKQHEEQRLSGHLGTELILYCLLPHVSVTFHGRFPRAQGLKYFIQNQNKASILNCFGLPLLPEP